MYARISRQNYDLRLPLLPGLNPQATGPHLYFRATGFLLTNADSPGLAHS